MSEQTNIEALGEQMAQAENRQELAPGKRQLGKKAGEKLKKAKRKRGRRSERSDWRAEAHDVMAGIYESEDREEV